MFRYLESQISHDLGKKLVILTGPRQVGKTTLSRHLLEGLEGGQYLNYDVPAHRSVLLAQSWRQHAPLLVLDEIHKMRNWKAWLKGVSDGRPAGQQILVTGSARMDTFRQSGDSLAGRYFRFRLHPISVREWCETQAATPHAAMMHLLERGGFPEPALEPSSTDANRWRTDYFAGLLREDILEFSRLQELGTMRLLVEMLRVRVGSPLSLASLARDLNTSPNTVGKYLDILEALFVVFVVRPWHRNIARATLQAPKVYFYDNGMVQGDDGVRFENLVACHLLKLVQWQQDRHGSAVELHYIRTKDDAEVDFALSDGDTLTHLIECKVSDAKPHRALTRFSEQWPDAQSVQLLRDCRTEADIGRIQIRDTALWLKSLAV